MKSLQNMLSRRVILCCVAGISVFALVQVLALREIMAPWWFIAIAIAVVVLLDGDDAPTSILTLTAVVVGLLPVAGFLNIPPQFSTLGLTLGCYVAVKAWSTSHTNTFVNLKGVAVITPALAGGAFTFWWWSKLLSGSTEDVLTRLMTQWDLSTHFLFFSSIARDGKYLLISSPPSESLLWAGREYPAGIHYVWSQFGLALRETSAIDRSVLIPFFAQAIVITGATAVAVTSLSLARLGNSTFTHILNGILGAALGVTIFCAGPLSSSFWGGFANLPAVVIGMTILMTFLLKPHHNRLQLWVLAYGVIALALNWYPVVVLFMPPLTVVFARMYARNSSRYLVTLVVLCVASSAPLIWLVRTIGLKRIAESSGGVIEFPETLLIGGALLCLGLGVLFYRRVRLEILLMLIAPAVVLYALGRYMIDSVGELRYYFDKLGLFVGTYLVVLVVSLVVQIGQRGLISLQLNVANQVRIVAGVLLVSMATSQMFGYWGPELKGLESETLGPLQRKKMLEVETKASDFRPLSASVLRESAINRSRTIEERSCILLILPKSVATDAAANEYELVFGDVDPANSLWLANIWFQALSDSATTEAVARTPRTTELGRVFDDFPPLQESRIDETIEATFNPNEVCILSTREINAELRKKSPAWRTFDIES